MDTLVVIKVLILYPPTYIFIEIVNVLLKTITVMSSQNDEMVIGWPLGLSFLNIRLRVVEASSMKPYQLHMPSTSFSSFSTSNLDTEVLCSYSFLNFGST